MDIPTNLKPDHPAFATEQKLSLLESALKANDPQIAGHLKAILTQLHTFPELLHLLKPEDVGTVVAGIKVYRGVQLVSESVKKAAAKKPAKIGLDDII